MKCSASFSAWQPLQLGAMSAANIASNLLFHWLVLTILGPGELTDALFAGLTLPQLFTAIVSSSLTHVLVPILTGEPHEEQRRDAWTLFFYSAALFGIVSLVLIPTAHWWVPLTVPGFSADAKLITVELASISTLGMVFTGMSAVQAAIGYARHRFLWADAAPMLANLMSVALLIWLLPQYGIWAAAWISVIRLMLQTLMLMPLMGKPTKPDRSRPTTQSAWQRLKPILLGASYYKLDPLVDRFLLSAASAGSLSLLYLSQQLHSAASQIVSKAFAVPAITQLAAAHKRQNQAQFASQLKRTLWITLVVCLLGIFSIWLVGQPLLRWGMARGEFTSIHAQELWVLLLMSAGMLVAGAMGTLTAGAFYAQGDTRTPTWLGSLAFTLGIVLKIAMFELYGVLGLAVAISVYYMFSLGLQLFVLWRRGGMQSTQSVLVQE
jgi:putative peptidoglycan lipid II flippase